MKPRSTSGSASGAGVSPLVERLDERLALAADARRRVLDDYETTHIIDVLARTAADWLRERFEPRRLLLAELPEALSLDPGMLERGLDFIFGAVTKDSLASLVQAQAPPSAQQPVRTGPPLVYYALAGNVPGLALPPIVASLLARSVCVVRDSRRQPLLTRAFTDSLAAHDVALAEMIVATSWDHAEPGARALEDAIVKRADRIELYGSDATVRDLAARYTAATGKPASAVLARGTRTSAGLVAAGADQRAAAAAFATDVVMYEGAGCLTPHTILVEGGAEQALDFAKQLYAALSEREHAWPRRTRGLQAEAARRAFIDRAEIAALGDEHRALLRGDADAWCVRMVPELIVRRGLGLRCVDVVAARSGGDAVAALAHVDAPLAAVGVAEDGATTLESLREPLERAGATLVCRAGRMQAPPIDWAQDGRGQLAALVETAAGPRP